MRRTQRLVLAPHYYVFVRPFSASFLLSDLHKCSSAQNYLPPPPTPQYYPPHSPPLTDAQAQRKRPKYTRSKTGCMTCRVKKIKVR